MSAPKDLDRQIESFLADGPMELPEASYVQVRDRTGTKRQRAFIGSWRTSLMSKNLQYGLAVAAAVLVVVIGYQLIGGSNQGGPGPTASVAPSESGEPSPSIPADGSLPAGPFTLWDAPGDIKIIVTIPGPGWFGEEGGGVLVKNPNGDPSTNMGVMVFQGPMYVYGDACHWSTTTPVAPVTTAGDLRSALDVQTSHDYVDGGEFWNIGGTTGRGSTLTVPADRVFTDCDGGQFRSWVGDPVLDSSARIHQAPGQVDELWTGDVNGVPVVFDIYYPGPQHNVVSELWIVVDQHATTFEMP